MTLGWNQVEVLNKTKSWDFGMPKIPQSSPSPWLRLSRATIFIFVIKPITCVLLEPWLCRRKFRQSYQKRVKCFKQLCWLTQILFPPNDFKEMFAALFSRFIVNCSTRWRRFSWPMLWRDGWLFNKAGPDKKKKMWTRNVYSRENLGRKIIVGTIKLIG